VREQARSSSNLLLFLSWGDDRPLKSSRMPARRRMPPRPGC